MTNERDQKIMRDLTRRGLSRREVLAIGARVGLTPAAVGAAIALSQQPVSAGPRATRRPHSANVALQAQWDRELGADCDWPEPSVPEPESPVTITVAHAWDATFFQRQEQFDELFMERHPNIEVVAENTPFGDYLQKYSAQAAGGALPDIMYTQFAWAQQLIEAGLFRPLDEYIAQQPEFDLEDFVEPSLISYQHADELYAIPYDEGPGMLYYNKEIFDAAGASYPDETWTLDTLKETAIGVTSGEGPGKIYGLADVANPASGTMAPPYLYPFGAAYVNEPDETECLLTTPEALEAMLWWHEIREQGAVPSPEDLQNVAWPAFQFGNIAMFLEGTWATPPIRENADFEWALALWPAGPEAHSTFSAGSGYGITRDSENIDAAWIYLNEYLSSCGQTYMWALTGRGSPARLSAWPAFLDSEYAPEGGELAREALETIASHEILDRPAGSRVTQTAGPIWEEVIAGNLTVEEALNEICAAIDPLLAQNAS
jgi:multiple sugar transport system substrate-binding protein